MSETDCRFQRQHHLSWIFPALKAVRSTVVPALLFFVFWQGCAFGWLAVLLVLPAIGIGFARYLALTYALDEKELVVRDGILSRNERRVRYSRIQNVDEVQGLMHRLLGVVSVRIETASGGEAEAMLDLSPQAVEELRRSIFAPRGGERPKDAPPPILEVPSSELIRLGLIRNRGLVVIAAAVGFAYQAASDLVPIPWERFASWIDRVGTDYAAGQRPELEFGWLPWIAGTALLLLGAYLLLSALSIVLAVVRFSGFRLSREGDDLTIRYGLLVRLRITVPRRRIQRLQIEETLLHRLGRRVSLILDTAGGTAESENSTLQDGGPAGARQWLAPIVHPQRLGELVGAALPFASRRPLESTPDAASGAGWRPIERRAIQRLFNRWSLAVLFAAFGLTWLDRWALVLPLVALPLVWWICRQSVLGRCYWATEDALWWRRGWPGRRLVVIPYDKIQSVRLGETPFDRRYRMARITLDTAGSGLFPAAHLAYLDATDARELARHLAREARKREFVWS